MEKEKTTSSKLPLSRRLRPLSYLRELSIVMIGILSTLTITNWVSESSKQKEIRETFLLVRMELEDNLKRINRVEAAHNGQVRFFKLLKENINDVYRIPSDTIRLYDPIGLIIPYNPTYDAYEVFKLSGLMQYVKDKTLLSELMQTYSAVGLVQEGLDVYVEHKSSALEGMLDGRDFASLMPLLDAFEKEDYHANYIAALEHDPFKFFVYQVDGIGIVGQNIETARWRIDQMIQRIGEEYGD